MTNEHARNVIEWRYDPPYSIYSPSLEDLPLLLAPENRYYSVVDETEELVGYCCFGQEARVPGGNYEDQEPVVLDVGVGMHPDKTGQGLGGDFVEGVLRFARHSFHAMRFRVTIAAFNDRSRSTFRKLGFRETNRFRRLGDNMEFVQLAKDVEALE